MPDTPVQTTLSIDIGGTHLKAGLLAADGHMVSGPARVDTPHPAKPGSLMDLLESMVSPLGTFQRISIGFPGVVRAGRVLTAPNLDCPEWHNFPLAAELSRRLGATARLANDATVQGLGVIVGRAIECVITLGTGFGFVLFENGRPSPHLELSQHPLRGHKTYDQFLGNAALHTVGRKRWNKRVQAAIAIIKTLTNFDALYVGGGNSRLLQDTPSPNVKIVGNEAGITGGIRLWDKNLDGLFS